MNQDLTPKAIALELGRLRTPDADHIFAPLVDLQYHFDDPDACWLWIDGKPRVLLSKDSLLLSLEDFSARILRPLV